MSLSKVDPKGLIYLASPYTHDSVHVREVRYLEATKACAYVINAWGLKAISPVVFSHSLLTRYPMPVVWEFWSEYDKEMIKGCEEVWVLCIPGFTYSVGANAEIQIARELNKRLRYLVPTETGGYYTTDKVPSEFELFGKIEAGRLLTENPNDIP